MSETPIHNLLTEKRDGRVSADSSPDCLLSCTTRKDSGHSTSVAADQEIRSGPRHSCQDKQGQQTSLVVDDDVGLQDLFRTFLKKIGLGRGGGYGERLEASGGLVT